MAWHAKPSGSYGAHSVAGIDNIFEINNNLQSFHIAAISGVIGNIMAESGLNPWRWQGDMYGTSRGYGLFQFTPASDYLALSGATPNLSVNSQTAGATPEDGIRQITAFKTNELGKWVPTCWRSYWDTSTYSELYAYRTEILNTYGHGSGISIAEFADITDISAATFVFLACFEGPRVPNLNTRVSNANTAYEIITGQTPPTPPTPPPDPPIPPDPPTPSQLPIWLLAKIREENFKRR